MSFTCQSRSTKHTLIQTFVCVALSSTVCSGGMSECLENGSSFLVSVIDTLSLLIKSSLFFRVTISTNDRSPSRKTIDRRDKAERAEEERAAQGGRTGEVCRHSPLTMMCFANLFVDITNCRHFVIPVSQHIVEVPVFTMLCRYRYTMLNPSLSIFVEWLLGI